MSERLDSGGRVYHDLAYLRRVNRDPGEKNLYPVSDSPEFGRPISDI